ncbi:TBC1 domain family member 5 homolog B-like [Papaver somniferum]|uniref:TBC1 domain family member 5 homolog B-like n=1 Tax=Papaver somniferum TaxID=3469 RepID=UPI000E6FD9AB|nr:TBC1 domain family member 5 homolog B-like [Papaver somniferum]
MISGAQIESQISDPSPLVVDFQGPEQQARADSRFSDLRGVQWRVNLGVLPSSTSIDVLRRVTADCRRRYAGLRRRLLVDPLPKEASSSPNLVMDNPLSQNPDSMWGRFFRNAELEKMVDQDLSRLYPEDGSYFQTPSCQGMLRRILLLWCIRHPEYGYGQGMHELLAPLLYVLHIDVERLYSIRKLHEDHFTDKFDDLSFPASDLVGNYKSLNWSTGFDDESSFQGSEAKVCSLDELDPELQTIVLLSDAYGAEGELGILLSERFMEHDAYCMFEALMGRTHGAVAMADYFSPTPAVGSHTGLPPVIEASSALYHLLSLVDSSLHSHLVELGVEPQYFALRWLRVLFGREFMLEDLLVVWDEIFAALNDKSVCITESDFVYNFAVLCSPRGAFISAMAVSMLLHLRSSLLATENATSCLQRLLNFPGNINVKKLIAKAKSLQALALDKNIHSQAPAMGRVSDRSKSPAARVHLLPSGSESPRTPLSLLADSYWEEKWRVLHKDEESKQGGSGKKVSTGKKGLSERIKSTLTRTESEPVPHKIDIGKKDSRSAVRRRLLEDLTQEDGSKEDLDKVGGGFLDRKDPFADQNEHEKNFSCDATETCLSGHTGSEESSFIYSAHSSPFIDREHESEKSSVASNSANDQDNDSEKISVCSRLSVDENDNESKNAESCTSMPDEQPLPGSVPSDDALERSGPISNGLGKQDDGLKDRKILSGKFQWLWKFGRNSNEQTSEKVGDSGPLKSLPVVNKQQDVSASSTAGGSGTLPADAADKNVMGSLRNLGQSMLENIQLIESVFEQDRGQVAKNVLLGKGQVTAVTALKELRKISNLLSEM